MAVDIAVESVRTLADSGELWPLLEDHRDELTTNKALMELSPDWGRYIDCERVGVLFVLSARENERLIGYSANFIAPHLHYSKLRYANNDLLFIARSHRRGSTGWRLIRETEAEAKRRGAQMMVWHAKPGTSLDMLLSRHPHYRVQDIMHSRILE